MADDWCDCRTFVGFFGLADGGSNNDRDSRGWRDIARRADVGNNNTISNGIILEKGRLRELIKEITVMLHL